MTDTSSAVRAASEALDYVPRPADLARLRATVARRVRQRRHARFALLLSAPLLAFALGVGLVRSHRSAPVLVPAASAGRVIETDDGSRILLTSAQAEARVVRDHAQAVTVQLIRGAARFEVAHKPGRVFRVESGSFEVEVLGTVFGVERDASGIEVSVERGRVQVLGAGMNVVLGAGESRRLAEPQHAPGTPDSKSDAASEIGPQAGSAPARAEASARTAADWRELARARQYAQAYKALKHASKPDPNSSADDLLLRADVARLSGHPAEAIESLRVLVQRYPADSRVPSAWFTLGTLEEQRGRPASAAHAFTKSRTLQPGGPLAEDALAREALALLMSGARAQAEQRALDYLTRYPRGVRAPELKARFGFK
jgi:transmembrane sensor